MSKRPTADMREIDRVHLEAMIHPVRLGAKPASSTTVATEDLAEVLDIVTRRDLQHSVSKVPKHDASEVYFFQKPHLKHVIENAPVFDDPVVEAWYWGKLYGYSEEAIASYTDEVSLAALRAGGQSVRGVIQHEGCPAVRAFVRPFAWLLSSCGHKCHLLPKRLRTIVNPRSDTL